MNPNPPITDPGESGSGLTALLSDTMADLETRGEAMVEDALRTGRPRRRRRVLASLAGGAAALVLVGGFGAYGLTALSGSPSGSAFPAAPPTSAPVPSEEPTRWPSADPSPTPVGPSQTRQLPARVAALYLTRLAPSGRMSEYQGQQSDELWVGSMIDRGEGKVALEINLQPGMFTATEAADFYRCDHDRFADYLSCDVVRNDDGSVLMTITQRPEGTQGQGIVVVADCLRADGTRVVVQTGNTSDTKYGGKPRRGVTTAEARAIATDPTWDIYRRPSQRDVREAERQIKPWTLLSN